MKDVKQDRRLPEASEAGQRPPTDANPTRQRYQLACHSDANAGASRQKTNSRQFNRGSRRGY